MLFFSRKNKGFTLIELLVVIGIVGILSTVVLASLNSARSKSRDANRIASIKQVQSALAMYYSDNGYYPTSADVEFPGILDTALKPTYISSIPTYPSASNYHYYTNSENPATFYAIYVRYESKTQCYVCGGSLCQPGRGWWGVTMCQ